ncbi:SDR family NAD(P)-dependent oxidoreductase [Proteobacteria bacterium 005FR1]|nr:SDR family NAD(P)-dependent oxidoreductase [Proteobacteria bacterium 005FR1]
MKTAIIIGASSGIGREIAKILSAEGYALGLTARRRELLEELQAELPGPSQVKVMDVAKPAEAMPLLEELIADLKQVDLFVINAGVGSLNFELDWRKEAETVDVNVTGFAAMANVAVKHLEQRGSGHLVGISSVAAIRGGAGSPAYGASKAFVSNYLEGLRQRFSKRKLQVKVTDVKPGFVDTPMAQGEGRFWQAPASTAARQIVDAIHAGRRHVYITRRWRLIGWLLKAMPDSVYNRM